MDDLNLMEDDDIVTLQTTDGEQIDFVQVAGIVHSGSFYAILQPKELPDMMTENEAFVFKVSRNEDGTDNFSIVLEEDIIDAVFKEYYKILDDCE